MIPAVAFCPSAPVLIPDVAQGTAVELDDLRAACREAIRTVAGGAGMVMLIAAVETGAETGHAYSSRSRGTLRGLGLPLEVGLGPGADGPIELPAPLTIGAWLVRDALGPDVHMAAITVGAAPEGTSSWIGDSELPVVVLGDGSARRSTRAPGYLDERAEAFDAGVERALRTGDADALAGLDARLGADLLASGVPAWRAVAPALSGQVWDCTVGYAGDPYGVMYLAASWFARG